MNGLKLATGSKIKISHNTKVKVASPTYTLTRSKATTDEGSFVTFTLTTKHVANGTQIPYTITGISSSDIASGLLQGNFTINKNSSSLSIFVSNDLLREGTETITLKAAGKTSSVLINDTSASPQYTLSRSSADANEGTTVTYTLSTLRVAPGVQIPYKITGIQASDLFSGSLQGNFIVGADDTSTLSFEILKDRLTEGMETLTLSAGTQSVSTSINDTSITPTYSLTRSSASVGEGMDISYTLNATNLEQGDLIQYTISGISSEDLLSGSLQGNFVLDSQLASTVTFTVASDRITEGTETMTIAVGDSSSSANIIDASVNPSATLILNANGSSDLNNHMFTDSSSNNFTITRNGTPTLADLNPFSDSGSIHFDGSNDYLTVPSSANHTFGTQNFTIEFWIKTTLTSRQKGYQRRVLAKTDNKSNGFQILIAAGDQDNKQPGIVYMFTAEGTIIGSTNSSVANGNWHHVAFCKSGKTMRTYLNGVLNSTVGNISTNFSATDSIGIGARPTDSKGLLDGYLSNIRLIKGQALYTQSTLVVPTTPLKNSTGTTLLLNTTRTEGANGNTFVDTSSSNFAITKVGAPIFSETSPFNYTNYGTISFDGSGDYLSVPSDQSLEFGIGDFALECWVYRKTGTQGMIMSNSGTSTNTNYVALNLTSTGSIVFQIRAANDGGQWYSKTAANSVPLNQWSHIVASRRSGAMDVFINGVQSGTMTVRPNPNNVTEYPSSSNSTYLAARPMLIGAFLYTGFESYFNSYISDIRIVKGSSVYATNFSIPSEPLTDIGSSLLINTPRPNVHDSSFSNRLIYTLGNSPINTSEKKYGTGSLSFDGSGNYLRIPAASSLALGITDFTIEFWCKFIESSQVNTARRRILSHGVNASNRLQIAIDSDESFGNIAGGISLYTTSTIGKTTVAVNDNSWHHIAFTRQSDVVRTFVDGELKFTETNITTNFSDTATNVIIGAYSNTNQGFFSGYVDDLRIIKGYAAYTSPFSVPTQQLTNRV